MTIKILGGELKGLPLFVPATDKTRPTSVLLKRRLFDSFQELHGKTFVDLCAGTGSIGFEALSRGADQLYAIEMLHSTFVILQRNGKLVQSKLPHAQIKLIKRSVIKWLDKFLQTQPQDTILFFDPPYEQHNLYQQVLTLIFKKSNFQGEVWVESDDKKGPPPTFWEQFDQWQQKSFQQGSRIIYIFSKY